MEQKQTVLIVDDDPTIVDLLRDFLEAENFLVEIAQNGQMALAVLSKTAVDCMLLDVMMPGLNGFELCRRVRETYDFPILFLSARDGDYDKIRGLGLGGDDYIVKSATPGEIVARIKAVLRRYRNGNAPLPVLLDYGRLVLDVRAHEVKVAGRPVAFTAREFELLRLLAENPRQVFTREQLFQHFWGDIGDRHTVTVHIGRIREKIEVNPNDPQYIVTVWGVGYRFEGNWQ
jgi:DNA-binding response OmpR family regulator